MALVTLGAVFWATTLAAIAAVGIYVIRIYKDVRGRPPYIVRRRSVVQAIQDVLAERVTR